MSNTANPADESSNCPEEFNLDSQGLLEQALIAIANVCDGASTLDGVGFNKRDSAFLKPHVETAKAGHAIALPLRPKVAKRLGKYGTQLFDLGINVNDVLADENNRAGQNSSVGNGAPSIDEDGVPPEAVAYVIQNEGGNRFAQNAGGKLYLYTQGVYQSGGEEFIRRRVKEILQNWNLLGEWSKHLANEVVEYVRVDSPLLWEHPPDDVINVINGLLNVQSRELLPHSPDFLSPVRIPVEYLPDAECLGIEWFINGVFPEDSRDLPYEMAGTNMIPGEGQDKAILLLGPGGNGKSVFLRLLRNFLGKWNIASISLHKLESNRFSCSRLVGMLANICPDLPSQDLSETSIFKKITGGDPVDGEYKYKDSFDFEPFARLIFPANSPPGAKIRLRAFTTDGWLFRSLN